MGDCNAKIGKSENENDALGKYGLGTRNENRVGLKEFTIEHKQKIINTYYKKKKT